MASIKNLAMIMSIAEYKIIRIVGLDALSGVEQGQLAKLIDQTSRNRCWVGFCIDFEQEAQVLHDQFGRKTRVAEPIGANTIAADSITAGSIAATKLTLPDLCRP
jgi:hypothetical protein